MILRLVFSLEIWPSLASETRLRRGGRHRRRRASTADWKRVGGERKFVQRSAPVGGGVGNGEIDSENSYCWEMNREIMGG